MEVKIGFRKAQFLVNVMFLATLLVWLFCDFVKVFPTKITPITHLFPESLAMFVLGLLFGGVREVPYVWALITVILGSATIWGVLDGHLFTILGINLLLVCSFLFGYVLQENKKIIEVEKA